MTSSIASSRPAVGGGAFPRTRRRGLTQLALALALTLLAALPAAALPDSKPYDDRLLRLSEILGAVHYLRELCGADEGQQWRDRMSELLQAEGTSALRKARLTRSFNKGYQSYSRTYNTCSPSAQNAINRFLAEGATIADTLVRSVP
ncbi:MAG TPA: TIGR02301 family protein [Hyphomicrobium sp.]|nr:TIGR02301 family protein [Hyphomicrobium sp.]